MQNNPEKQLDLQFLDVLAPSQFGRACWFAAEKQTAPRVINVGELEIHIGRALETKTQKTDDRPAFDVDHGLVLMALMRIHQEKVTKGLVNGLDDENFKGVSYNDIAKLAFGSPGGETIIKIKKALFDLRFTPVSVKKTKTAEILELTFLDSGVQFKSNEAGEVTIEDLMFSRKFRDAMMGRDNLRTFDLEIIRSRRTKHGKALAPFYPAKLVAGQHLPQNPYVATTTKIIESAGGTPGKNPSDDNKAFERGDGALVQDLTGLKTSDGRKTMVKLQKQGRGKPHLVKAWLENGKPLKNGKLIQAVKEYRGWSDTDIAAKLHQKKPLETYEVEQLKKIGVDLESAENFIIQFKAFFPNGFSTLISELLDDRTGRNKNGLFISKAIKYAKNKKI